MENKKIGKPEDILSISFSVSLKGYNPHEVDLALDSIYDYSIELLRNIKYLNEEIVDLEKRLSDSLLRTTALEVEAASLKKRIETNLIDSDSTNNIDYLERIRKLEMELHRLGKDPRTIK